MSMRPTRKIIIEFVGVFSVGALAGGLLAWKYYTSSELAGMQFSTPPLSTAQSSDTGLSAFLSRTNDPASMVARISKKYADEYQLTADEQKQIQPLIEEMAQHSYEVRHQFGLDIMATLDEYHQKIAAQLTPEHRAAYEKASAEHRKKLYSMLQLDQATPTQGSK